MQFAQVVSTTDGRAKAARLEEPQGMSTARRDVRKARERQRLSHEQGMQYLAKVLNLFYPPPIFQNIFHTSLDFGLFLDVWGTFAPRGQGFI